MAEISIGRGKNARRAYGLDDIAIVPSRRTRANSDVDLGWKIDAYRLGLPVVAAGIDAPLAPADAAAVAAQRGLGMVDLEALWSAHEDPGRLRDEINRAKGEGRVAACVSPSRAEELVPHAVRADVDLLVVRAGLLSAQHVSSAGATLDLKTFIRGLDVPVIVGGCASYNAALHLMRTGAAGIIVGVSGRDLGIDVPLATAIADARAARVRHLDETSVYCHLIASGPIRDGVDVAKAIAVGADAVMIDASLLLQPGEGDRDPIDDTLRRSMAACGYTDVKAFQKAEVVVR